MFRPATAGDAADMVAAHFAAVRGVPPGHYDDEVLAAWSPTPDDQRRVWLANVLEQRDAICEVAVVASGTVVGFCLAFPSQSRLQALYVHPRHSGLGIGTGLLRAVEGRCQAAGTATLELNASYNAAPFYRANGYADVRETTQALADGTTMGAILMLKPLAASSQPHDERQTAAVDVTRRQGYE